VDVSLVSFAERADLIRAGGACGQSRLLPKHNSSCAAWVGVPRQLTDFNKLRPSCAHGKDDSARRCPCRQTDGDAPRHAICAMSNKPDPIKVFDVGAMHNGCALSQGGRLAAGQDGSVTKDARGPTHQPVFFVGVQIIAVP